MSENIKLSFIKTERLTEEAVLRHSSSDALIVLAKNYSEISVKDELCGKSEKLLELGGLTKKAQCPVFVGFTTDSFRLLKKSVAVFFRGKLVKLADNVRGDKSFAPSFGYKTVSAGGCKFGIAVGKDVCDHACLFTLSSTENDVIINLSADFYDFSTENLVSSLSYIYGVTIVSVNADKTVAAASGKIILSTADAERDFYVPLSKTYKEILVKQRGLY